MQTAFYGTQGDVQEPGYLCLRQIPEIAEIEDLPVRVPQLLQGVGPGHLQIPAHRKGRDARFPGDLPLLHPGGVMILDEATSSLDMETEERLLDNIRDKYKGIKTVVFISHRPAATRLADNVLNL